jgi:hypothetical protein
MGAFPPIFMRFFRSIFAILPLFTLLLSGYGQLADNSVRPTQILPAEFGGWQLTGSPKVSSDPAIADPANAGVLKEYGFKDFESASYTYDDGRKLTLRAARFADASGAYGAFTFYKMPEMQVEQIGDQAASLNNRVLFYRGNVLMDAVFERLSAMSAAELRELAGDISLPAGENQGLPGLPAYLPQQSYVKNSAKYVVGPLTLEKVDSLIPAPLVGFDLGAEVEIGNYNSSGGEAALMLIAYPTPQIAGDHLRRIEAAQAPNSQSPDSALLANAGRLYLKRTGPIVVVAGGPLSKSEAEALLASVNYDANVTWNENTHFTKKDNVANLLVNVILLCFIIIGFALVVGVAFGGVRVLAKRLFPDRVFDRSQDMEFISLHLTEEVRVTRESDVSSSIKTV